MMREKIMFLLVGVVFLISFVVLGCSKQEGGRAEEKFLSEKAVAAILEKNPLIVKDAGFGNDFKLLGVTKRITTDGIILDLYWKSLKAQPLQYTNFVHFLDGADNIIGQADHAQDSAKTNVKEGMIWHDTISVPENVLTTAKNIGIGLYIPPDVFTTGLHITGENISMDLKGFRLLIPITALR